MSANLLVYVNNGMAAERLEPLLDESGALSLALELATRKTFGERYDRVPIQMVVPKANHHAHEALVIATIDNSVQRSQLFPGISYSQLSEWQHALAEAWNRVMSAPERKDVAKFFPPTQVVIRTAVSDLMCHSLKDLVANR